MSYMFITHTSQNQPVEGNLKPFYLCLLPAKTAFFKQGQHDCYGNQIYFTSGHVVNQIII